MNKLLVGCHVSAAGGCFNAPKNAHELGCETFQMFTRPPQGGTPPKLTDDVVTDFKKQMEKYEFNLFVVHCPYFINFGSAEPRISHGSAAVVRQELERSNLLGAAFVMTHLGTAKALGQKKAFDQTKKLLVKALEEYEASKETAKTKSTQLLLEIAAGAGEIIGDTFEELEELAKPLQKFKTFGGICFDTQHAFSSGYDLRTTEAVAETFKKFDTVIGLKWLKMSHMNDSKTELAGRRDRHDHIGEGHIGKEGFKALLEYFYKEPKLKNQEPKGFPLILETEHDKVKADIKILKTLRDEVLK